MIRLHLVFLTFFLVTFGVAVAVSGYAAAEPGEHVNNETSEPLLTTYSP